MSGTVIVYQLPSQVQIERLEFSTSGGLLFLQDGLGFQMDLTEGSLKARV